MSSSGDTIGFFGDRLFLKGSIFLQESSGLKDFREVEISSGIFSLFFNT